MNDRIATFREWFLNSYIHPGEDNFLIILPIAVVQPRYRDEFPGAKGCATTGLRTTYLSPYLGAPKIAIPGT
jgi:hypothetical protein